MLDGWAAERLFESDTTGGNILHVTYAKELKTEMLRDDVNELKVYDDDGKCIKWVKESDSPKMTGWICPVCGRGLSPWTSVCPCKNTGKGWEVTC